MFEKIFLLARRIRLGTRFIIMLILFVFTACLKEHSAVTTEAVLASDEVMMSEIFELLLTDVDAQLRADSLFGQDVPIDLSCRQVTKEYMGDSAVFTVNYGSGCSDSITGANIIKSGKMLMYMKYLYTDTQYVYVRFDHFSMNAHKIEGELNLVSSYDTQSSDTTYKYWRAELNNGKVYLDNDTVLTRNFVMYRSPYLRLQTPWNTWSFYIEGTASGLNRYGQAYSMLTYSNLYLHNTCQHFNNGITKVFTGTDGRYFLIDFSQKDLTNCYSQVRVQNSDGEEKYIDINW